MDNYKNKILSLLLAILVSWGCQEIIEVDLTQADPKIVIEGRLTDERSIQKVRISETLNYYDTSDLKAFAHARVSLLNEDNILLQNFIYSSDDKAYQSNTPLELNVGQTYKIQIEAKGEVLVAEGEILENATLDSLFYLSDEELKNNGQPVIGDGYFLFVSGQLNSEGVEYFKLDVIVNDTLQNSRDDFANSLLSTEFLGKKFSALPVPGVFEAGDSVSLELYTLNEDVDRYYLGLIDLLFNDGGIFSPPPINPDSNIENLTNPENKPLGYIQFSSVQKRTILIEGRE